ncbi:glycosyltransferase family A protein [Devosia sp. ZB163]|uniref:glycosyltransferase family A protein n=1 Tax=Devosia sp. ZB163 TaxID=3025938 RepID=UPI002360E82D|nr:glycosyltransferase family A protein [Devosia sp. ZB163]MDC9825772.1 glycosyltransferase family A protein [Devosia sp. ZB163]
MTTELNSRGMAARMRQEEPRMAEVRHTLPADLVISLTSYPPRFPTLVLTIKSLIRQSIRPDRIVLWLAHGDAARLPKDVAALSPFGLEVRECEDGRSYNKIVPALEAFPEAFIVTADDDRYYPPEWLDVLVRGQLAAPGAIVCHRARVMQFDEHGSPQAYKSWYGAVSPDDGPLMPAGYGGVLYPPGSLPKEATDRDVFTKLCPTADDLWLKWMSAAVGTRVRLIPEHGPPYEWPGSQSVGLVRTNIRQGGNDRQAQALATRFGTAHVAAS